MPNTIIFKQIIIKFYTGRSRQAPTDKVITIFFTIFLLILGTVGGIIKIGIRIGITLPLS